MPSIDRRALRHTLRHWSPWLLLVVAAGYLVLAVMTASMVTALYGCLFLGMAGAVLVWRYREFIDTRERLADQASYRERRDAQHAEHLATMAAYAAEREQRAAQAQALLDEEIRSGARCPAWCDGCDEEQRQRDADTARFLRERAARHGHPSDLDEDRRAALVELNARLHPGHLSPEELLDDESLAHLHATQDA
ncbi:MAG: hypothetical protein L0I24_00270 [Pseudonocardia sp.]|nr:hypothetical protein [Pseudonocardia sp.]